MSEDTVPAPRPVPVTDDPDTGGFWAAAAAGRVAVLTCRSCSSALHLPVPYCAACGSWDVSWRDVAPRARVYSRTTVEQSVHPGFVAPYTVVLVELDDAPGVRLLGHLEGRVELPPGTPMVAEFEDISPGVVIPNWRPLAVDGTVSV